MDDARPSELPVGSEENGGAENPLERANQPSIFFAALVHSERVEHFRTTLEADRLALLPDGKSGQENQHDSVLSEREAVIGMPCHLENELSVPALKPELTCRRATDGEAAKNKRTGTESEILLFLFPLHSDQLDPIELSPCLPGDSQPKTGILFCAGQPLIAGTIRLPKNRQGSPRVFPRGRLQLFLVNDGVVFDRNLAVRRAEDERPRKRGRLPNFCPISPKWGDVWLLFVG